MSFNKSEKAPRSDGEDVVPNEPAKVEIDDLLIF